MAFETWIHVVFPCTDAAVLAGVAHQCQQLLKDAPSRPDDDRLEHSLGSHARASCADETGWLLDEIASRRLSIEGGLVSWGTIGNYSNGEVIARELAPFFQQVLTPGTRALIFTQGELQGVDDHASCWEIFHPDTEEWQSAEAVVTREHAEPQVSVVAGMIVRRHGVGFSLLPTRWWQADSPAINPFAPKPH